MMQFHSSDVHIVPLKSFKGLFQEFVKLYYLKFSVWKCLFCFQKYILNSYFIQKQVLLWIHLMFFSRMLSNYDFYYICYMKLLVVCRKHFLRYLTAVLKNSLYTQLHLFITMEYPMHAKMQMARTRRY